MDLVGRRDIGEGIAGSRTSGDLVNCDILHHISRCGIHGEPLGVALVHLHQISGRDASVGSAGGCDGVSRWLTEGHRHHGGVNTRGQGVGHYAIIPHRVRVNLYRRSVHHNLNHIRFIPSFRQNGNDFVAFGIGYDRNRSLFFRNRRNIYLRHDKDCMNGTAVIGGVIVVIASCGVIIVIAGCGVIVVIAGCGVIVVIAGCGIIVVIAGCGVIVVIAGCGVIVVIASSGVIVVIASSGIIVVIAIGRISWRQNINPCGFAFGAFTIRREGVGRDRTDRYAGHENIRHLKACGGNDGRVQVLHHDLSAIIRFPCGLYAGGSHKGDLNGMIREDICECKIGNRTHRDAIHQHIRHSIACVRGDRECLAPPFLHLSLASGINTAVIPGRSRDDIDRQGLERDLDGMFGIDILKGVSGHRTL